nr:gastrula zinc finger protein XlCGF7.1-like [Misgurnus anguillicaudatus]
MSQKSFVGVQGSDSSRKEPSPTKMSPETLLLSPAEESVGRFCRRMKYKKKCIIVSDESSLNSAGKLPISQPSNSSETNQEKYSCNICGIEYCRKGNLASHMRIHTGETPYDCKLCGKLFRRSDYLKLHIKVHMGEQQKRTKRFVCEQCGMKFVTSGLLQCHMWKHSGERPYACSLCEKTFFSTVFLKRHMNDCHLEERSFTCSLCGHSFKRVHTLRKHMRIHTGEKPYSCSQCGKTFSYKYSLILHNKRHSCKV